MDTEEDRLRSAPKMLTVCANCGGYMLPPRCVCGWCDPDAADQPEEEDDTDLFEVEAGGES